MTAICKARDENTSLVNFCRLDAGHKGLHWGGMCGHFYARDDDKPGRDKEQAEINLAGATARNEAMLRPRNSSCNCSAGVCPKPEYTFGEGHYCSLPIFHTGEHQCRRCGNFFNSNSIPTHVYQYKEGK